MFAVKVASYTMFTGCMGMMILPIVMQASASLAADAALITGLSTMSLALIAYNAPSESYLRFKTPFTLANIILVFASIFSVTWPASRVLQNIWLAFGTAITAGMVMYHTQAII